MNAKYLIFVSTTSFLFISKINAQSNVDSTAQSLSSVNDVDTLNDEEKDEVIIQGNSNQSNVRSTQMGQVTIGMDQIKKLPRFLGEVDPIKALQLMPGVKSAEGSTGLYVRGGGPDQNLVLLDGMTIYNPGHLLGFFSVFNADALKDVTLTKGGIPAYYGGRLSSVLDVTMKKADKKEIHGEGGVGIIASRGSIELPFANGRGSMLLSGRRTYLDILIQPALKEKNKGTRYYFYDLNLKVDYKLGAHDYLTLSGYMGKDLFNYNSKGDFTLHMPWGNKALGLNWQHFYKPNFQSNTSISYNDYNFDFNAQTNGLDISLHSGIRDYNFNHRFDWNISSSNKLTFGISATQHLFTPNQLTGSSQDSSFTNVNPVKKYALEGAAYVNDEFNLGDKLQVSAGLRASGFGLIGPYTVYNKDESGNVLSTQYYGDSKWVKKYGGLEPRFSIRYQLTDVSSLKAGISRNYQYVHMVSNNGSTLPTDNWVPSSFFVNPEKSWQYSLGYYRNFNNDKYQASVEVYYKDLQNQIEYKPGYTPNNNNDPEDAFTFGKGNAYGAEFFVNKKYGRLTGWVGYTLSWTWRKFAELNYGDRFPSKYDRRNDISIVATYELNKKWTFSGVFVYGTGNALTLPTSYYIINGSVVMDYSKINSYRAPAYHRMDLSAVYTPKGDLKRRFYGSWAISLYNAYNHMNPYIIYIKTDGTLENGTKINVKQVSIFSIIPTVTYNFKF